MKTVSFLLGSIIQYLYIIVPPARYCYKANNQHFYDHRNLLLFSTTTGHIAIVHYNNDTEHLLHTILSIFALQHENGYNFFSI